MAVSICAYGSLTEGSVSHMLLNSPNEVAHKVSLYSLLETHVNLDSFQARGASNAASKQTSC